MSEGIKKGDRIGMSFGHGSVDHPVYGKADNLCGVIPLLLPYGEYTIPPIVSDKPRLDKLVKNLTNEYKDLWEDELEDDIAEKVKVHMFVGAFSNPQDDPETPGMLAIIANLVVIFAMDDIMDQMGDVAEHGLNYSNIEKVRELYLGMYDGIYKRIEDIPNSLPVLQSTISFFWKACRRLEDVIPKFHKRNIHMRDEWEVCVATFILLMERSPLGEGFSERSLKIFGAHNSGFNLFLEAVAMLRNVTLRPEVRKDVLVRNILEQTASVSTLMNAVFGLGRDIKLGQVHDSSILRQVVQGRVTLEEGFNNALSVLCDEMNDLRVGIRKLRERYAEDKDLIEWVRLVENVVDGQYYCYKSITRYGNLGMKVVKV